MVFSSVFIFKSLAFLPVVCKLRLIQSTEVMAVETTEPESRLFPANNIFVEMNVFPKL